jgi:hypothetical protein
MDSSSAIATASKLIETRHTRHIQHHVHFVEFEFLRGNHFGVKILGTLSPSDIGTKHVDSVTLATYRLIVRVTVPAQIFEGAMLLRGGVLTHMPLVRHSGFGRDIFCDIPLRGSFLASIPCKEGGDDVSVPPLHCSRLFNPIESPLKVPFVPSDTNLACPCMTMSLSHSSLSHLMLELCLQEWPLFLDCHDHPFNSLHPRLTVFIS